MADNSKDGNQRRTLDTTSKRSSSKNLKNTAGGGLTDASKIIPSSHDGDRRRSDDVASIITSDSLAAIRKKFHVPNDVLIIAPKRTDRAHTPPQGFVAVYEMTLRAGLRFPPAPELLDIFKACGVALPQFLCRAVTIIVGLIVFFRERGATLTVEYLSKMCKFTSDSYGRISCRANKKWLDFVTRDPSKNWYNSFFFVKNEWGLPEKWDKLKELPSSLHVGEGDILRILNFSNTESLQQELRYISRCVTEECLFKVGLSIQAGRSHAIQLKKSEKTLEVKSNALKRPASHSSEGQKIIDPSSLKKRKPNDKVIMPRDGGRGKEVSRPLATDTVSLDSDSEVRPSKIHIPEDVLKHICIGRRHDKETMIQKMNMESKFESILDDWNDEFVKVKFLQGEYKRRLEAKTKETSILEGQLTECRTELATISTSLSFQNREADLSRHELIEAHAEISQYKETLKKLALEKNALEKENKKLQDYLHERETTNLDIEAISLKAVEEFKESVTYRREIQHLIQEAYEKLFDVEVKDLERQSLEEGFTRGFLKGVRLVHRKTGVDIEGLTPVKHLRILLQIQAMKILKVN
ncbi:hypothetical protein IEQ34_013605 [Dendrobium chrysotoxum]|uniref:Uncharacterized protein n=1 Tax=Dendrobium chrysotoxum TaxID=161865 RepID=A0AAV7GPW9_DENCH|nr:hypothetical protein IEQ34_013605 [Dendrobium chrysotoxum]